MIRPVYCPHGRATSHDVTGASPTDPAPEIEWCPWCSPEATPLVEHRECDGQEVLWQDADDR